MADTGISIESSSGFNIGYTLIENNGYGIDVSDSSIGSIYDCAINNNSQNEFMAGVMLTESSQIDVQYCTVTNQTAMGLACLYCTDCLFYGNTFANSGVCGLAISGCDNTEVSNNFLYNNGIEKDNYYDVNCGLAVASSNCTIIENQFENNANALYWLVSTSTDKSFNENDIGITNVENNIFHNNSNTFLFTYEQPTIYSNQSFVFSNNLVNDTSYVNPSSLQLSSENAPINGTVLNFNGTVELGRRISSAAPFVGGNYWAYPNGTGPSQIGVDANRDGFLDTPLELLGNATAGAAYDYHAYSDNFDTNQWVDITLPAIIYSSGHYRIMNSWSGIGEALVVAANDVVVDGRNCSIQSTLDEIDTYDPQVLLIGNHLTMENLTVQDSFAGFQMYASNSILRNIQTNNTFVGGVIQGQNVTVANISVNNTVIGLYMASAQNFTISNCTILNARAIDAEFYGMYGGIFGIVCDNFTIENTVVSGTAYGSGFSSTRCSNFRVKNCNFSNNALDGFTGVGDSNFTFVNSFFVGNGWGVELRSSENANFRNCQFSDNGQAIYAQYSDVTFVHNIVNYNNNASFPYSGGVESADSNFTAVGNIFDSNFDSFIWTTTMPMNTTTIVHNNIFRNNNYTLFINNQLPNSIASQELLFFNNLVNDTAYVDPTCLNTTYSGDYLPFNESIISLNVPIQSGARIYGVGSMMSGNYWAHPNGAGPSQTGVDSNRDGFLDSAFDIFGDDTIGIAYDYFPLSSNYALTLSFAAGASQTLGINQISNVITVKAQDSFGDITSGLTVNLATSCVTGSFYSDAAGTNRITSIAIPEGSSTASFYYRDSASGDRTITVYANDAISAQTGFDIAFGSASSSSSTSNSGSSSPTITPTPTPTVTPTPTPTPETIQATKEDSSKATITINSGNIAASQYSNATITTNQTASTTILSFTVTGETDTTGFCNLTIAKSEIPYGTTPTIYIDGVPAENQGYTEDANNYYLWYTTHFSIHQISVQFSGVKNTTSETPVWTYAAVVVLVVAVLAVALVVLKRRHK